MGRMMKGHTHGLPIDKDGLVAAFGCSIVAASFPETPVLLVCMYEVP